MSVSVGAIVACATLLDPEPGAVTDPDHLDRVNTFLNVMTLFPASIRDRDPSKLGKEIGLPEPLFEIVDPERRRLRFAKSFLVRPQTLEGTETLAREALRTSIERRALAAGDLERFRVGQIQVALDIAGIARWASGEKEAVVSSFARGRGSSSVVTHLDRLFADDVSTAREVVMATQLIRSGEGEA